LIVAAVAIVAYDAFTQSPLRFGLAGILLAVALLSYLVGGKPSCGDSSNSPP